MSLFSPSTTLSIAYNEGPQSLDEKSFVFGWDEATHAVGGESMGLPNSVSHESIGPAGGVVLCLAMKYLT
jgi:hypothetical protein